MVPAKTRTTATRLWLNQKTPRTLDNIDDDDGGPYRPRSERLKTVLTLY